MLSFKIKKVGNHWYPCIPHPHGTLCELDRKAEFIFNKLDKLKSEELTIELEEQTIFVIEKDTIFFHEQDITKYFTTNDFFQLRIKINNHIYTISSDLYWLLENAYHLNLHDTIYSINIY